jgi:hypothetical protein
MGVARLQLHTSLQLKHLETTTSHKMSEELAWPELGDL